MNNKQVTLDIFHREDETISVGDIVATTTSEFDYNGITHTFDKEATKSTTVRAIKVGHNYDDYVPEKSCNGGCYGFDFYEVTAVITCTDCKLCIEQDSNFCVNPKNVYIPKIGGGND